MRSKNRYADWLRSLPWFRDLSRTEARFVARLIDDVCVDGKRTLVLGPRERTAIITAIPRLAPVLEPTGRTPSCTRTSAASAARTEMSNHGVDTERRSGAAPRR